MFLYTWLGQMRTPSSISTPGFPSASSKGHQKKLQCPSAKEGLALKDEPCHVESTARQVALEVERAGQTRYLRYGTA